MRGLAVLVMIEAHVIDSWTRLDARHTWQFGWSMILGGFGAPLFLYLAGLSVALSAGSKLRRTGDATAAARFVMMRGLWVFGLAFLFWCRHGSSGWARRNRSSKSTSSTSWDPRSWLRPRSGVRVALNDRGCWPLLPWRSRSRASHRWYAMRHSSIGGRRPSSPTSGR